MGPHGSEAWRPGVAAGPLKFRGVVRQFRAGVPGVTASARLSAAEQSNFQPAARFLRVGDAPRTCHWIVSPRNSDMSATSSVSTTQVSVASGKEFSPVRSH